MPLVGEISWWANASAASVPSGYNVTWTVEMPPSAVFAKVTPFFYMEYHSNKVGMMGVNITRIRRRRPDDSDETVNLGNDIPAVWEPNMTSVTFGLYLYNCQGRVRCDLGFWE